MLLILMCHLLSSGQPNTNSRRRILTKPVSPFEWWKNKEPTVFAKDPYFRGNYKVTPLRVNAIKLNNKTFKLNA